MRRTTCTNVVWAADQPVTLSGMRCSVCSVALGANDDVAWIAQNAGNGATEALLCGKCWERDIIPGIASVAEKPKRMRT